MTSQKNSAAAFLVCLCGLFCFGAFAADCNLPTAPAADDVWDAVQEPRVTACVQQVVDAEKRRLDIHISPGDRETGRARAIRAWFALIQRLDEQLADASGDVAALLTKVRERAQAAWTSMAHDAEPNPLVDREAWSLSIDGELPVVLRPSDDTLLAASIDIESDLHSACAAEGPQCPSVGRRVIDLVIALQLAQEIGSFYGQPVVTGLADRVAEIDADWDRFVFHSKPMYPWDLVLTDWMTRESSRYDQQLGLREAPDTQYFVLHPAPGFSYVSSAADGDELEPTVYLELFGVNKWRWKRFTGLSLIAEYADRSDLDDIGYGLLLTYSNKYSLGIVGHDGEIGLTLSLDLANFYTGELKPKVDEMKKRLP